MKAICRKILLGSIVVLLAACGETDQSSYQGWVEGDFIFVAPDEAGRIEKLNVREGSSVKVGEQLFTLDAELQTADLKVADATLAVARQSFDRAQLLLKSGSGSQKTYDEAEAALREAEAKANAARTRLTRRQLSSPVSGTVQQVYYRVGEVVPAARPAISILPPGNMKVRFFVPEPVLAKVAIDDAVAVRCDGCAGSVDARVSFIAGSAEYTPPVIYSLEERRKLVYLIEARPAKPDGLRVGLPVTVEFSRRETQ